MIQSNVQHRTTSRGIAGRGAQTVDSLFFRASRTAVDLHRAPIPEEEPLPGEAPVPEDEPAPHPDPVVREPVDAPPPQLAALSKHLRSS